MIKRFSAWWRRRSIPKPQGKCIYCSNVATIHGIYCGDCWDLWQSGWAG